MAWFFRAATLVTAVALIAGVALLAAPGVEETLAPASEEGAPRATDDGPLPAADEGPRPTLSSNASKLTLRAADERPHSAPSSNALKLTPRAVEYLGALDEDEEAHLWVFFADKGIGSDEERRAALARAEQKLTERARKRRLRSRPPDRLVDEYDLPVSPEYVAAVAVAGAEIRTVSRWLNAASVSIPSGQVPALFALPSVESIDLMRTYRWREPAVEVLDSEEGGRPTRESSPAVHEQTAAPPCPGPGHSLAGQSFDYGYSSRQIEQINVDAAHGAGYFGSGVLIAMLDTGFERRHKSLRHLDEQGQIIAEHDFVYGDDDTRYNPDTDTLGRTQTDHGTRMLSLIAGFRPTQLIGPAFAADYLLFATEILNPPDHIVEEHWWIAGSERADSIGADIISSSLGYQEFDDTTDYTYSNMDGNTALTTVAADIAASRGILVLNAMGNVGGFSDDFINAPADADSIVAVGGIDIDNTFHPSSIRGPTYDGRIKPEVVGPYRAWTAQTDVSIPSYEDSIDGRYGGTSMATALVAGLAALVLEANPTRSAMELREAIMETASAADAPNDSMGWGIADAWAAMNYYGQVQVRGEETLLDLYPNPFLPAEHAEVIIPFRLVHQTDISLRVYSLCGELVKEFTEGELGGRRKLAGEYVGDEALRWDGMNDSGKVVASGVYLVILSTGYADTVKKLAVVR
jgi:serine protease AprX